MAKSYTTDNLVESLKRRAAIPISQQTFTEDDLVDYLNDEMESTIVPILMDYREEYFVEYIDYEIPINQQTPAKFEIPQQALGQRLREVSLVDISANGEESLISLPLLSLEQISANGQHGSSNGSVFGFYMQGNNVHLYPSHGWGEQTVRLYYFSRPGALILEKDAGNITAINYNNNTLSVDNTTVRAFTTGDFVATIRGEQPFNYLTYSAELLDVNGYTLTFADVSTFKVGDWICDVGESVFPQIPIEGHNMLLQAAKIVMMESIDDEKALKLAKEKYDEMAINFTKSITPRIDGAAKKIVTRNGVFSNSHSNWI